MKGAGLVAAGSLFVGLVLGGFALGLLVAARTHASWWVIVGTFAGLFTGVTAFAVQVVRATK